MKNLESALRFGCPLLVTHALRKNNNARSFALTGIRCVQVHDVENIDPVVNPVLNREIYKKGGRVLIRPNNQVLFGIFRFVCRVEQSVLTR